MDIFFVNPGNNRKERADKKNLSVYLDKKPLYIIIEFSDERMIGLTEVKRLLALYKEMLNYLKPQERVELIVGRLDIFLYNNISNFDLTFIAALNLVKFSFEKINIRLLFGHLTTNSEEEECFYRFGQFAMAGLLAYGKEIFGIMRSGKLVAPNFFLKNLSGYLPFIYVNENHFEKYFLKPIKDNWEQWWNNLKSEALVGLEKKSNQADKIYQELRHYVIESIDLKGDPEQNFPHFYIIYLFNAVRKFHFIKRILKNQLQKPVFSKSGISIDDGASPLGIGLSRKEDFEYEDKVQLIFEQILEKPPAFVMLFSYFIEVFYDPQPGENASYIEKINTRIDFISKIFYFTDEIFYGVRELAKNIIEHSSSHRGVIIGRAVSRDYLVGLKKESYVEDFLKTRPGDEKDFIDFIVLDDGNRGIIDQTIKNLENLENEFSQYPDFVGKFKEDIEDLKTGKIKIDDFFNPGEIKLKYQEIRSALSVGLLIFSHLVLENNGYMMVSSTHRDSVEGMALFQKWVDRREINEIVPLGTFYNIIFPKNLIQPPATRSETIPFEMPSRESAFNIVLKQVIQCIGPDHPNSSGINTDTQEKRCYIDFSLAEELTKDNIDRISALLKKCGQCTLQGKGIILTIDLKMASKFDHSDLFRFLARIQQTRDIKSIIVYNVKEEIVKRFIDIFKIFKKMHRNIGSKDHFVLFYYQPTSPVNKYFSFLLAGESLEDICWINEKIARTSYTKPEILQGLKSDHSKLSQQFDKNFRLNPLFTGDGHLLPFDVLIKADDLTLFENNVLSNLLEPGMHPASPSYTFKEAHMRLGSKIHLTDFFYARRIFQNSFYSLRFAFLVCRYIQKELSEWLAPADEKNKSLTVFGYGMYSELLISNVVMFLKSVRSDWRINHAVIDDTETLKVEGDVGPNVILLIPISSTLSTSLKIKMHLKKTHKDSRIIGNPISILIVGNGEWGNIIDQKGSVIEPVVCRYWKSLDIKRKIIIPRSPEKPEKKEKFFLYLPSQWHRAQDCELCFPENPAEETVLFEADKVSVTPSLIFELPAPKPQPTPLAEPIHFGAPNNGEKAQEKAILTESILSYGHTYRGNNHYLYYVDTDKFLKENETFLKDWLKKVKDKLKEKADIFNSKVILIAPTHFTNSDFINMVNEIVFNDAATLFHYDQDEDYIQNLKSFFGQDIGAEAYVFFIDDAICGGSTYEKLNNFVKYARTGDDSRGIDCAIVLINRLMQDKYSVFLKELKDVGFFAFVDLEVPIMIDSAKFCHLCSEKAKYERMLSDTILDSLRILIRAKIMKLEARKYEEKDKEDLEQYKDIEWNHIPKEKCRFAVPKKQANYLKRLEYIHRLYRAFDDNTAREKIEKLFKDNKGDVKNYNKSMEDLCKIAGIHCSSILTIDEKVDLIKVLSNPYFVYHKEIRKYIFKIVIFEMEQIIKDLGEIENRELQKGDMDTYRYLKFLINRAAALKANYIIRVEILEKIFSIYYMLQNKVQKKRENNNSSYMYSLNSKDKNEFLKNLHGFADYYMMAVKEVSWSNEANSLKLEETLTALEPDHKSIDEIFSFLTQSLRIENISIPYRFVKSMEKQIGDIALSFTEQRYSNDIEALSDFVINYCLEDPYRSETPLTFLGFKDEQSNNENKPQEIKLFLETDKIFQTKTLPMILLKAFLLREKKGREENTREKPAMDYILYCLCKILDIDIDSGGAFFVAKYMRIPQTIGETNFFTISHIGKNNEIDSFAWEKCFASKMFFDRKPYFKSIPLTYMQILKQGDDFYTYYDEKIDRNDLAEIEELKSVKNLLFLRLADDDLDSTARGVIVFYSENDNWIKPEYLRFAMILKNDIFDFLNKNYENYSFKLYEEKSRQLKELEALNKVIAQVTSAADSNKVYDAVKSAGDNIRNIHEMCLLTKKDEAFAPILECNEQIVRDCDKCKQIKLECIIRDGSYAPYYCPDVERDTQLRAINHPEIKSQFIIPLIFNKELLGILALCSKTSDAFSPFERKLLESLGDQVAIAINNRIKQEKQREIYKDISHSLNTNLTTMRSYSQSLIEGKVKDENKQEKYLKWLYGDLLNMSNSVDEIVGLAKLEYRDLTLISEKVELIELINNLAGKNEFLLREKQLNLKILSSEEKMYVKADKQKLENAFQSLMNNAIKFTDKKKDIHILVSLAGDYVLVKIKDQGYGIHPEDLGKIFEKYERGRYAKEQKIPGTGIGLAVVKYIVEKHSGEIMAESELGKGSTFTVRMPLLKENELRDK